MNKTTFENVIAYRFSEAGAMGAAGTMTCLNASGEKLHLELFIRGDTLGGDKKMFSRNRWKQV